MKILVVEDYKVTRMKNKKMIEKGTDWDVQEAQDGQGALEALVSYVPDLIILDLMMPNMNGYEFLQNIRNEEKTKNVPVLILTGLKTVEDEIKGLQTGANDYLTKPINMDVLISRSKKLIRRSGKQ